MHQANLSRIISIVFTLIIGLYLLTAAIAIYRFQQFHTHLDAIVDQRNVKINLMNSMLKLARERSLTIQSMLLTHDPFEVDELNLRMSGLVSEYFSLRDALLQITMQQQEASLLELQHQRSMSTGNIQNDIAKMVLQEQYQQARQKLYSEAIPAQNLAMSLMEQFIAMQNELNREQLQRTKDAVYNSRIIMLLLVFGGSIFCVIIAFWVIQRLHSEINRRNSLESTLEHRVHERTKQLQHLANHDSLTHLPNRSCFSEKLRQYVLVAQQQQRMFALLFMDLDGFKLVNDTYGHETGDKVLVCVAKRMQQIVRDKDVIARLGGDEFVMLLANPGSKQLAHNIANRLITLVDEPIQLDDHTFSVGLSIGISFYPDDATSADELLTRADDFMYVAKNSGKNCFATEQGVISA